MADLRDRFATLDRMPVPDLWADIERRLETKAPVGRLVSDGPVWRAAQQPKSPDSAARGRPDRRWLVLAALLATLAVVGALVAGSGLGRRLSVVPASPLPTVALSSSGDPTCTTNLVQVTAGGSVPQGGPPPPVAVGERFASLVPRFDAAAGHVTGAQLQVATATQVTTVATITSAAWLGLGSASGGGAEVEGWSPDGSGIVVWAGHDSPNNLDHLCSDLYLVAVDGSSVVSLTGNPRPGYFIPANQPRVAIAPLAQPAGWLAYVEGSPGTPGQATFSLRTWGSSGPSTVDAGTCQPASNQLAWSPDGRVLAILCGSGVELYAPAGLTTATLALPAGFHADLGGWAGNSRVEVAMQGPTFEVIGLATTSGAATVHARLSGRPDLSALGFSADGAELLVAACPATKSDPSCFSTDLDILDTATGALRRIWSGASSQATNDAINSARWEPGGSVVMTNGGSGTLVVDPATGHVTHSAWSIGALLWRPAT